MTKASIRDILLISIVIAILSIDIITALPEGPSTFLSIENRTNTPTSGTVFNTSGGRISIISINATTQNYKWKAYIGNITGVLTLDDANSYTIYDWSQSTSLTGEVYATRSSATPTWANIVCANLTHLENENNKLKQTNIKDNLTATFDGQDNNAFVVGSVFLSASSCWTTNLYVNNTKDLTDDFEEVVLYDGTNTTNGDIIFAALVEEDKFGYDNSTYDFQMLVPDNGSLTFSGSIAYYFYVELL